MTIPAYNNYGPHIPPLFGLCSILNRRRMHTVTLMTAVSGPIGRRGRCKSHFTVVNSRFMSMLPWQR